MSLAQRLFLGSRHTGFVPPLTQVWGERRDGSVAVAGCRNGLLYLWRLGPQLSSKPEKLQTRIMGGISALACSPVKSCEVTPPRDIHLLTVFRTQHVFQAFVTRTLHQII